MSQTTRELNLLPSERDRFNSIRNTFRAALKQDDGAERSIQIDSFLPPPGDSMRIPTLLVLIPEDLDDRWRRGQSPLVEDYLTLFSELSAEGIVPGALYFAEYMARCRTGKPPPFSEYESRCTPKQYKELLDLYRTAPSMILTTPAQAPEITVERRAYAFEKVLGSGGFGKVVRARDHNNRVVAIKIINLEKSGAINELKAFENIKNLGHPFVVRMEDVILDGHELRIVMELVDQDLEGRAKDCLEAGKDGIPADELLSYFRCAAKALDDYRAEGILHLDIKPQNIMLHRDCAKLADFGLSRVKPPDQSVAMLSNASGTPFYIAPEVLHSEAHNNSDQFSLALSYVVLRAFRTFKKADTFVLQYKWRQGDFAQTNITQAEQVVLRKALAENPKARYSSCNEFVSQLEAALAPPPAPTRVKQFRALAGTTIIACLAVVGMVIYAGLKSLPKVTIHEPPSGFYGDGTAVAEADGTFYYPRIVTQVNGRQIPFVLIPSEKKDAAFYMMENKVSNSIWKAYQESLPIAERGKDANSITLSDDDPVFNVGVEEAQACAHWLGGDLPTWEQWDRAAGINAVDGDHPEGPYLGKWGGKPALDIALNGMAKKVGKSKDDVSFYKVMDMAGNGFEWTRSVFFSNDLVPLRERPDDKNTENVVLRGHSFRDALPLRFDELSKKREKEWASRPYKSKGDCVSFRRVIEP